MEIMFQFLIGSLATRLVCSLWAFSNFDIITFAQPNFIKKSSYCPLFCISKGIYKCRRSPGFLTLLGIDDNKSCYTNN
jgi:hypothetical protein